MMKITLAQAAIFSALLASCLWSDLRVARAGENDEPYRPQFHFTPSKNWMNDPHGPLYYKGEYHLLTQPVGNEWGHMSWGHAVSDDLVHWKRLPVAIPDENGIMIFSGSTVVDWHNSSGFCSDQQPLLRFLGLPEPWSEGCWCRTPMSSQGK